MLSTSHITSPQYHLQRTYTKENPMTESESSAEQRRWNVIAFAGHKQSARNRLKSCECLLLLFKNNQMGKCQWERRMSAVFFFEFVFIWTFIYPEKKSTEHLHSYLITAGSQLTECRLMRKPFNLTGFT